MGAIDYLVKSSGFVDQLQGALDHALRLAEVEQRNARLAAIVESSDEAIVSADLDGPILTWNAAAERLYGYSAAEVKGLTLAELVPLLVPPDRASETAAVLERVRRGESTRQLDTVRIRKDGSRVEVSVTVTPWLDAFGHVTGLTAIARDSSTSRQTERLLRESKEQHRAIFEMSPLLMWLFDIDTLQILMVNEAALRQYGYTREELLSMTIKDVRPPEDVAPLIASHQAAGSAYRHVPSHRHAGVWRHVRKDGSVVHVDVHVQDVTIAGRHLRLALLHDVTDRHMLEEQLRQAQKMDAIGRLAGGIAHDFNNILTAILGYSDLVLGQVQDPTIRAEVEEIRLAGERAAALTGQLLAFSRKQTVEPRTLNLNVVTAEMDKMLQRVIGDDVKLVTQLDPALGSTQADPGRIEQILLNLAVNARDAMPRGGKLTIKTANMELDEAYAKAHVDVTPGRYVMLAVSDTGTGMDAATRERVFEPFFTTKAEGKGTGIGLATVYGIVKQANGHVWLYSDVGKGTTFKIYFPRSDEAPIETGSTEACANTGHETVLVVEDEAALRRLLLLSLETQGYRVLEASNGNEALAVARSCPDGIDLVLSDSVMPGLPVDQLLGEIRTLRPGTRILLMSGYAGEAIVRHGILPVGTPFLQKPFAVQALLRRVREVLDTPASQS